MLSQQSALMVLIWRDYPLHDGIDTCVKFFDAVLLHLPLVLGEQATIEVLWIIPAQKYELNCTTASIYVSYTKEGDMP